MAEHDAELLLDETILSELDSLDGGSGAFLRQIVGVFVGQADELVADLQNAVDASDAGRVGDLAHKLKGSARTVGAARLGRHCEGLEAAARGGDLSDAPARLEGITRAYAEVRGALEARVG